MVKICATKERKREKERRSHGNCSTEPASSHRAVQGSSDGYWLSRSASRLVESAYRSSHRALQDSCQGSPFPSGPPEAGRAAEEASGLPEEKRFRKVSEPDPTAGNKEIAIPDQLPSCTASVKCVSSQRNLI